MMKALVVDDSSFLRRLICDAMQRLGFNPVEASDGALAVEMARREKPTIILMDMIMPKMDGYEATKILKNDPKTAKIPIIAITSQILPEERKRAEDAGCDAFFEKPYNFWELRETIKELIK
ncbi:response regulator [candidate division CSSED10-310 bacterium]|uniref:Response regulator n=1 Tax=candidate division CSSED10-310 bacterium TaxID=2855610 RepID=A0ABV6YW99_UNCC1